jgi:hypothetical protein
MSHMQMVWLFLLLYPEIVWCLVLYLGMQFLLTVKCGGITKLKNDALSVIQLYILVHDFTSNDKLTVQTS